MRFKPPLASPHSAQLRAVCLRLSAGAGFESTVPLNENPFGEWR